MSYRSFKPVVVSKYILEQLEGAMNLVRCCTREFEGEVKEKGQVRMVGLGRPTIVDFTGILPDPEIVPDSSLLVTLDQAKAFSYQIPDIDKAFAARSFDGLLLKGAKRAMAAKMEKYVGEIARQVKGSMVTASAAYTTADGAFGALMDAVEKLRENDVDGEEAPIYANVSWAFYRLLWDKLIDVDTDNSDALRLGFVKQIGGVFIRPSNNLYNDGTDDYIMVRTQNAIGFALGIDKIEPFRPEKAFSDAVKGLFVYGGKLLRAKECCVIKAH